MKAVKHSLNHLDINWNIMINNILNIETAHTSTKMFMYLGENIS
jgi:hypothetical protein